MGAAGGKDDIHQGAQRTDGIAARAARLAHDEDLDRPQLAHAHAEVEVAEDTPQFRLQERWQLLELQPGDSYVPHLRNVDRARAINLKFETQADLSPGAQHDFIARPNHVVGGNRYAL